MAIIGALVAAAYVSGSLPFGVWLSRPSGIDVRHSGSGNTGATNVARTVGWRRGLLTLLCDTLKGFVPALAAKVLVVEPIGIAAVCFAAVFGHVFSCFLRFRGGKGVATALGVYLAVDPIALAPSLVVFAATVVIARYVSLASILATVALPLTTIGLGPSSAEEFLSVAIALLILWRHTENIERLLHGRELRVK